MIRITAKTVSSYSITMVNFRITWTLYTGAVGNSAYQMGDWTAQLEIAPTKHVDRKCLHIYIVHHN